VFASQAIDFNYGASGTKTKVPERRADIGGEIIANARSSLKIKQ
jgi:hypothetical protein